MTPDARREHFKAIFDSLDEAQRILREAHQAVVSSDVAVGDGNEGLRHMIDAQARIIEQHHAAFAAHLAAMDLIHAANRAAVDLLNSLP